MAALPQTADALARLIDHTLLSPSATAAAIDRLCAEARSRALFSVCVNPCWVARARAAVAGSEVAVCTVIGFPLGANASAIKAAEAERAITDGASELDMVINVGWLLDGDDAKVREDVAAVVDVAGGRVIKWSSTSAGCSTATTPRSARTSRRSSTSRAGAWSR
jgi:deoxyribose-phosphate aldolase